MLAQMEYDLKQTASHITICCSHWILMAETLCKRNGKIANIEIKKQNWNYNKNRCSLNTLRNPTHKHASCEYYDVANVLLTIITVFIPISMRKTQPTDYWLPDTQNASRFINHISVFCLFTSISESTLGETLLLILFWNAYSDRTISLSEGVYRVLFQAIDLFNCCCFKQMIFESKKLIFSNQCFLNTAFGVFFGMDLFLFFGTFACNEICSRQFYSFFFEKNFFG